MWNEIFMMLLQVLYTYKLQVPVTFTGELVLCSTWYRLVKSTSFKGDILNSRKKKKKLFSLEMDKSICMRTSIFLSCKPNAHLTVLKMKALSGKMPPLSLIRPSSSVPACCRETLVRGYAVTRQQLYWVHIPLLAKTNWSLLLQWFL